MSFVYVINSYENNAPGMKNIAFFDDEELAIKYLEKHTNNLNNDIETDDSFYYNKLSEIEYSNHHDHYVIIKHKLNTKLD